MNWTFTIAEIEAIAVKLRDWPPAADSQQAYSLHDVFQLLSPEINALKRRGYTPDDIAVIFLHATGQLS